MVSQDIRSIERKSHPELYKKYLECDIKDKIIQWLERAQLPVGEKNQFFTVSIIPNMTNRSFLLTLPSVFSTVDSVVSSIQYFT